jgi:di/tricarboxylate transporter
MRYSKLTNFLRASKKENIGLILRPIVFVIVLLFPFSYSVVTTNHILKDENLHSPLFPQIALGTMLWMVIWWVTECVPLGFTSLLAPFIFIISGILTVNQALPKFSDPIIWIFISGFVLAAAFNKSGLDKRIAYNLAILYKGNNPKISIFFIACLPVFLLSMTGSITAATAIVFPFVLAFINSLNPSVESEINKDKIQKNKRYSSSNNKSYKLNNIPFNSPSSSADNHNDIIKKEKEKEQDKDKKNKYAEAGFLSLGQAATAGAMLLLISTAPNLIAKATVEDFAPGRTISFTNWFIIGFPHAIIGLLISWNIVFLFLRPQVSSLSTSKVRFKKLLNKMGKITMEEKIVLAILFSALTLWIFPSIVRTYYPDHISINNNNDGNTSAAEKNTLSVLLSSFAKNIPESIPALLIILSIGLIRIKKDNGKEKKQMNKKMKSYYFPILSWDDILTAIDWNILFLFGGGLVLGLGIESSGLASLMGNLISHNAGANLTEWSIFAISAIMSFIMSYAASNTASAVIICPIAASLAVGAGFNPIPPIIAAGLAASISSAIPSTTPPMAIIYSSKVVSILNMFKTGIVSDLLRLAILILIGPMLIYLVF